MNMVLIQVVRPFLYTGLHCAAGDVLEVSEKFARQLKATGQAKVPDAQPKKQSVSAPAPEAPAKSAKKAK